MNKFLSLAFALCICSQNCFAQDSAALPVAANPDGIAVLDFKKEFNSAMDGELGYFKENCGYALETNFNISNLSQGTSEEDARSVSSYCANPLTELVNICSKGEEYKAVVAKNVKKLTCRYLGNSGKRSITLNNGELTWSFEYESEKTEGNSDFIAKFLKKVL